MNQTQKTTGAPSIDPAEPDYGGWIMLASGKRFYPLRAQPEELEITDIAAGLSNMCRFAGHCRQFYSVAQHSVWVSRLCGPPELALWGLLHDASEAFIADIARPIKHLPELEGYRNFEKKLMEVVCLRFGLPFEQPAVVKTADNILAATEARDLMPHPLPTDWILQPSHGYAVLPDTVIPMGPVQAYNFFLGAYEGLRQHIPNLPKVSKREND